MIDLGSAQDRGTRNPLTRPGARSPAFFSGRLWELYRSCCKNVYVEEPLDLVLLRPVSFLFVLVFLPLRMTPNKITLLSAITGFASGIAFARGDRRSFLWGAALLALSQILDCCDGMVARIRRNGSDLGRILDGLADYAVALVVLTGFAVGTSRGHFPLPCSSWTLTALAAASYAVHAILYDRMRSDFEARRLGIQGTTLRDAAPSAGTGRSRRTLGGIYAAYLAVQSALGASVPRETPGGSAPPPSGVLLLGWGMIGTTAHSAALVLSGLRYDPFFFFSYAIVFANVQMALLFAAEWVRSRRASAAASTRVRDLGPGGVGLS